VTVDVATTPGLLTDQQQAKDPAWLRAHGYDWLSFQVYNPHNGGFKDRDLAPAKQAGLSAGVWGVTYGLNDQPDAATFKFDGERLGSQAVKLGGEHVIVDAEMCAKFTRDTRGMQPIVDGLRAGGWFGPVHWTPLGAPSNPRTAANPGGNDFGCDERSFLETGGGVLPQEYLNESPDYAPALCKEYWLACGIPADRLNHLIAVYAGARGRITGSEWAGLLREIGVKRNFSIYMVEMLEPFDLEGLDPLAKATLAPPPPPPAPIVSAKECREAVQLAADRWLNTRPGPETLSRLRVIRRIAAESNTDPKWNAARAELVALLDRYGF
jgi:hypothetical protein